MAKGRSAPIPPAHKRCNVWNDSRRYVTDSIRAFDIGRGGHSCPEYIRQDAGGLYLKYCAGWKQRRKFVAAMRAASKPVQLTAYELLEAARDQEAEEERQRIEDAQLAILKAALVRVGLQPTAYNIAQAKRGQVYQSRKAKYGYGC